MLHNPPGSFRSGADAILLAAWAAKCLETRHRKDKQELLRIAELGSGNGSALLALAMQLPQAQFLGLEKEEASVRSAILNAQKLGIEAGASFVQADLEMPCPERFRQRYQLVMANPPWRKTGSGEPCGQKGRQQAIYGHGKLLPCFCKAAFELLVYHGLFCMIFEASRLVHICYSLNRAHLGLRLLQPVASFERKPASRLLILAQKFAKDDAVILPDLVLHEKTAAGIQWTQTALHFSPWLRTSPFSGLQDI